MRCDFTDEERKKERGTERGRARARTRKSARARERARENESKCSDSEPVASQLWKISPVISREEPYKIEKNPLKSGSFPRKILFEILFSSRHANLASV